MRASASLTVTRTAPAGGAIVRASRRDATSIGVLKINRISWPASNVCPSPGKRPITTGRGAAVKLQLNASGVAVAPATAPARRATL
jgi:hypothetical protein